jgi:hypothetical protein
MEEIKDILDQIQGWHIVLTIYGGCILWLVYEFFTAPLMPEDYDLSFEEKELWKDLNKRNDNKDFEDDYENQPFAD